MRKPRHIDIPAPHIDIPSPHIDVGDLNIPHVDLGRLPPGDTNWPHVDIGSPGAGHIDATSPHIDVPHEDVAHADAAHGDFGHVDIRHVDLVHSDIGRHVDLGHADIGRHVDIQHFDQHFDVPHFDVPLEDIGLNHWWQNWPKTHAYVAKQMFFPTTVLAICDSVQRAEKDGVPVRAVGGGWSFSDASLPGSVATNRPTVVGADAIAQFLPLAQGFPADTQASVATIDANPNNLISYDQSNDRVLGQNAANAVNLENQLLPPQPQSGYLINTRSFKSSLQVQLQGILSQAAIAATTAGAPNQKYFFHVEAGVTMDELSAMLDTQSPRLQLGATGGNPGATLAGTISSATHGAEFAAPLLIDRVRAVHLVGPGGQQWWIEGTTSVADPAKLQAAYPGLDAAHILTGTQPASGLLPQDWLNAVVVSMGCMGVIYSVVIEVFPLAGNQQVTVQTTWAGVLQVVQSLEPSLLGLSATQLQDVLRTPSNPLCATLNSAIANAITSGIFSSATIPSGSNTYADLALNPIPAPPGSQALAQGDCDCWIVNRQTVPVPMDPQPPAPPGVTDVFTAVIAQLVTAFGAANNQANMSALAVRIADVYGFSHPFHVDVPLPHIDIPAPHIDIPAPHIDLGHVDIHFDFSFIGHVDIEFAPHIDIPAPHIDIPAPHIDIPLAADIDSLLEGLLEDLTNPLAQLLTSFVGLCPAAEPLVEQWILSGFDLQGLISTIQRITNAHDTLDVALDALTAPLVNAAAMDLAQPFLTGFLASTLGTDNPSKTSISVGTGVGAIGFPNSGMVGAGIEVSLPVEQAFSFLQARVLDPIANSALFGYISCRICPQTSTHLGMQQWPTTVAIEVVAFGNPSGVAILQQLQRAWHCNTLDRRGTRMTGGTPCCIGASRMN